MPYDEEEQKKPVPKLRHPITCPRCQSESGQADEEVTPQERGDLLEGLAGITTVQCLECYYEWEIVTHKQILHSMRNWIGQTQNIG